jgi:outer membrane murein-binding lipoprotein Lpp
MRREHRTAVALGSLWLSGCFVPERQYDEAVHTLRAEQAAHRQTTDQLYELQQKLAAVNERLDRDQAALEARQQDLAQSKFDYDIATNEREDAVRMVDQLRGELARVGDHLRVFADQKSELSSALQTAEGRAAELRRLDEDFTEKALLMRDLTHALHAEIGGGAAALGAGSGEVRLRLRTGALFDGNVLLPEARATLEHVAMAVAPVGRARLEITEHPRSSGYQPEDVIVRMQTLADVLAEAGLPFERVTLALPKERAAFEPLSGEPTEHRDVDVVDDLEGEAPEAEAAPAKPTAPPPAKPSKEAELPGSWKDGPGSIEIAIRCAPPG